MSALTAVGNAPAGEGDATISSVTSSNPYKFCFAAMGVAYSPDVPKHRTDELAPDQLAEP